MSALTCFASYVVFYPRIRGKTHKSVEYAAAMVATIRRYYRYRNVVNPGDSTGLVASIYLKKVYKGLGKMAPTKRTHGWLFCSSTYGGFGSRWIWWTHGTRQYGRSVSHSDKGCVEGATY